MALFGIPTRQRTLAFAAITLLTVLAMMLSHLARAQQPFPSKPLRVVTTGAGSQNDLLARIITPKLQEIWGQPVVIENRAGAGGQIAASVVAKATPDGYTILMLSNQFAIGAALNTNLPYDPVKDFAGITQLGTATVALVVPPSLNVKSTAELIAMGRAKQSLLFGSAGAGSGTHMNGEMFRMAAGFKGVHVGFKTSSDASLEVAAGRVHYGVLPLGPLLPFVKDNRVIALAVAKDRSPHLPDVPAMSEVLPNFERAGSFGFLAPAATPRPILNKLSRDIRRVLDLSDVKDRLQAMSFAPAGSTPEAFEKIVQQDIQTFIRMAKAAGLRPK